MDAIPGYIVVANRGIPIPGSMLGTAWGLICSAIMLNR